MPLSFLKFTGSIGILKSHIILHWQYHKIVHKIIFSYPSSESTSLRTHFCAESRSLNTVLRNLCGKYYFPHRFQNSCGKCYFSHRFFFENFLCIFRGFWIVFEGNIMKMKFSCHINFELFVHDFFQQILNTFLSNFNQ